MRIVLFVIMLWVAVSGVAEASISMSFDRDMVDFRVMQNGQTTEISDMGTYHNQLTCSSTNNVTWYIKVNMVQPLKSGLNTIPIESFKWVVVDVVNGKGIVANNVNVPTAFSTFPFTVYTSDPVDNTGTEVSIRFRYILSVPKNQVAGNYVGSVRWTMTELL